MPIKVRNDDNYLKIDKLRNSGWEYLGILKSALGIPSKVKDDHNYLKIDNFKIQGGNTWEYWEYLGIPGNTWEYLGIPI